MYSPTASATSSIASVASCCVVSTPRPRRVTVERRSCSVTRPLSTSATRRRVEFVPMSTTATRTAAQPSDTRRLGRARAIRRGPPVGCAPHARRKRHSAAPPSAAAAALAVFAIAACGSGGSSSTGASGASGTSGEQGAVASNISTTFQKPTGGSNALGAGFLKAVDIGGLAQILGETFEIPKHITVEAVNGLGGGPHYDPSDDSITFQYGFAALIYETLKQNNPDWTQHKLGFATGSVLAFILEHEFTHALISI